MEPNSIEQKPVLKNSPFALVGMILGIVCMVINLYGIVSVCAIVFSGIGLRQINDGMYKGKGMAITGLVLGIVGAVSTILTLVVCGTVLSALGSM